jgi:hypothetical protein
VLLFDLRSPRSPLALLKGHAKAVSYVRWAGPDTLVSASTDATLRLWAASGGRGSCDDAAAAGGARAAGAGAGAAAAGGGCGSSSDGEEGGWHCVQVLRGHTNRKHFVGLATHGPFVACGSETNEVFVYHQGLPQPSMRCLLAAPHEAAAAAAAPAGGAGGVGGAGVAGGAAMAGAGTLGEAAAAAAATAGAAAAGGSSKRPFVSALAWRGDGSALLAANSKGGIWLLAMQ